ncbi:MAG: T9SS type B sorting domain-containing protein, partial [Pedobacter sp.]
IMGGGGGGGDANDALSGVKGGVGGGLVLINVGRISGIGVILANGGNGAVGAAGNNPDGAGGGGAGGTVFIKVSTPDLAAVLNIQVKGGNGGNTERDGRANNEHGTGGGGGGGLVFYTTAAGTLTTNVGQGLSGITNSGNGTKNGARDGTEGLAIPFDNSDLPFYLSGGGEACYPQLTTTMKLSSESSSAFRRKTFVYEARITNSANGGNAGGVKLQARFPKEFLLKNVLATVSGDAGRTYSVESSNLLTNNLDVVIGDFNISPGDYVTFSLTLEAGCDNPAGLQNSSAQEIYLDPTRTAADPNRLITALTNSFDGNTTYESNPIAVPGLNYNGTMSSDEDVTIIATPPLINSIAMNDGNPALCDSGNPGVITGTVSGGNGDYTYQWQSSSDGVNFTDILSASQASFDPEAITSTTFYRRKVFSACVNDVSSNIISIRVAPTPVADFEMPDFCLDDGMAVFTNKSSITDGTQSQLSYLWDYGDGSPATSSSNHTYTGAGEFTVKLTVTSVHGCVAIISKIFTVHGSNPLAKFNFSQLCSNSEVVFEDAAEQTSGQITKIEWFFDMDNHPSDPLYTLVDENPEIRQQARKREYKFKYPDFSAPESKTVNVKMKVYSGQSCTNEVIKTITLYASPEVRFDPVEAVCEAAAPFTITQAREIKGLPGNGIYSGNGITATGLFNPSLAGVGVHAITYTFSTDNCSASETILITVKSSPIAQAGRNLEVLANGQIMLPAVVNGNNLTYQWTPALGLDNPQILNPVASPKEDTEYKLTATSDEGCEVEVFYKVIVLKELKIPNTFTPNGDGTNDYWDIPHLNTYPGVTVQVFNRYGQVVFNSKGYPNPWNGNWNSQNLPAGTYYYLINPQQGLKVVSGSITIIR